MTKVHSSLGDQSQRISASLMNVSTRTENIIFAHECIHSLEGLRQSNICFKIDFSEAYDRVSWVFLKNALLDLGFNMAWVDRVIMCVFSPSFVVLIDGIPCDFHPMRRGLRQGDPMSLYLFLVVMEELSRNLEFRRWNGSFTPPYIPRVGPCPSFLTFADDLIIFSRGDHHSYNEVTKALDALKLSSGLCVNPHKSHAISFGEQRVPLSFINNFDWRQGSLPLPYLSTPLFSGNMQDNLCASLDLKFLWVQHRHVHTMGGLQSRDNLRGGPYQYGSISSAVAVEHSTLDV
ncbi:retrotransposable element ORF2 protein [Nymphaea thermarum]|nr:retrotransposable element ORF2 protein [Nymphaea thermarum]